MLRSESGILPLGRISGANIELIGAFGEKSNGKGSALFCFFFFQMKAAALTKTSGIHEVSPPL